MNEIRTKIKSNDIESSQKSIDLIYEDYLEKVLLGKIFPQSEYRTKMMFSNETLILFKKYFKKRSKTLTLLEEEYLIDFLNKRIKRWFVPHFLGEVNHFSRNLMVALIEAGMKIKDPSYNNCFLIPAKRIYKSEVNDYLVERFKRSNLKEKKGIFRLFYWLQLDKESKQNEDRLSLLINEYQHTRNKKMKYYLSLNLPNNISDYPDSLKKTAKIYLENKK